MQYTDAFVSQSMSEQEVERALVDIQVRERALQEQRRALLNRKAFLLAELYVVVTIDGKATLYGVSAKHHVKMPEFIIRMADNGGVIIELLKEDRLMSFPCSQGHALLYKESQAYDQGEHGAEEHMFSYDVFKDLQDAETFVQGTNESLLGDESPSQQ